MARRSAFRRALSALVMVPLTILLVVFAVSNREPAMLSLWPLSEGVSTPLYLLVLALFALGALIGMVVAWLSGASTRRALREATRRAERAEREMRQQSERVERLERALIERRGGDAAERRAIVTTP